jgi:hypothetical protein
MKSLTFLLSVLAVALVVLAPRFASSSSRAAFARAEQPAAPAEALPQGYGTDAVVAFYEALLQEKPPTIEQERAIFTASSGVRTRLVVGDKGEGDVEPMKRTPEQRRARELQIKNVADAGPVVLEYLRKHSDSFIPVGGLKVGSCDCTVR